MKAMPKMFYCWRCQMEIPMLDDKEALYVLAPMKSAGEDLQSAQNQVLHRYFEITGLDETNSNADGIT